jgi:uncharacterized protein YjbI with pentapeptide repeats
LIENKIRRLLLENVADELRSTLASTLGAEGTELASRFIAASSRAKERKLDLEIPNWNLRSNAGYWRKRIEQDPSSAEDLARWIRTLEARLTIPSERELKDEANRAASATSLVMPSVNGKDYKIVFKFSHESAKSWSRKLGGSKLCTAGESCTHFDHYSIRGPLVTLTAIPGESVEERNKQYPQGYQHDGDWNEEPEETKPSSYNIQLVLDLRTKGAMDGPNPADLDPSLVRYGEVMWYDDARFQKPYENLERLYGITPEILARMLMSDDARVQVFREHIWEGMDHEKDRASIKKNLRSKLELKDSRESWLANWLAELEENDTVHVLPPASFLNDISEEEQERIKWSLENKKFVNLLVPGDLANVMDKISHFKIKNSEFDNCRFAAAAGNGVMSTIYVDCRFNNCTFEKRLRADFRGSRSDNGELAAFRNSKFENGFIHIVRMNFENCGLQGIDMRSAHIEDCRFNGTAFNGCNLNQLMSSGMEVDFGRNHFEDCRFDDCDLTGIRFDETMYEPYAVNARFKGCNLTEAHFSVMDLRGSSFDSCDLSSADFTKSDLTGVPIRNCTTQQTKFDGAKGLTGINESKSRRNEGMNRVRIRASQLARMISEAARMTESNIIQFPGSRRPPTPPVPVMLTVVFPRNVGQDGGAPEQWAGFLARAIERMASKHNLEQHPWTFVPVGETLLDQLGSPANEEHVSVLHRDVATRDQGGAKFLVSLRILADDDYGFRPEDLREQTAAQVQRSLRAEYGYDISVVPRMIR